MFSWLMHRYYPTKPSRVKALRRVPTLVYNVTMKKNKYGDDPAQRPACLNCGNTLKPHTGTVDTSGETAELALGFYRDGTYVVLAENPGQVTYWVRGSYGYTGRSAFCKLDCVKQVAYRGVADEPQVVNAHDMHQDAYY